MKNTITRKQYLAAQTALRDAQNKSVRAMRAGNQQMLDAANEQAVKALAIIADYKSQQ